MSKAEGSFEDLLLPHLGRIRSSTTGRDRLLLFDYDGTLTPIVRDPAAAIIPPQRRSELYALASQPSYSVWIVSGRDTQFLSEQFPTPGVGLAAEHGAFIRDPGTTNWIDVIATTDFSWRPHVQDVFNNLCQILPNTNTEQKTAALVWHWRGNQPEGRLMAPAVHKLLHQRAQELHWPVQVTSGKCIIEVRPQSINKGGVAREILRSIVCTKGQAPGLVVCVGDDLTDEDMFGAVKEAAHGLDGTVTVRVLGEDDVPDTTADFQVQSPAEVWQIVSTLRAEAEGD